MLSFVRAFASAFSVRLTAAGFELRAEFLERLLDLQVGVPDVEVVHRRELAIAVRYCATVSSTT